MTNKKTTKKTHKKTAKKTVKAGKSKEYIGVLKEGPSQELIFPDVSKSFTSLVQIAKDILSNPDIAYRTDRVLADQMIRDPMVMAPLQKRMLATAQLEWQVLPEDDDDEFQVEVAKDIDSIIRAIPKKIDFFRDLLWATFRGTGVSEIYWYQDQKNRWAITGHRPHHGDKFTYDLMGNPHILTQKEQTGGRALKREEVERLIIHVFDPEDGSFFNGAEAAYLFKGRGLRDVIWQYWWLKHNALKFWLRFIERYGGGMSFGRYPLGNKKAKTAIESVLQNLMNDSCVSIPVPAGAEDKGVYGVEVQTIQGAKASAEIFAGFVEDWAGHHIRQIIEGQELTSQAGSTGLGSDLGRVHQDTFRMYRDYDAMSLEDTINEQLVARLQRLNYGNLPFKVRFGFILEKEQWDEQAKRVEAAGKAGMEVPKRWLYETLGVPIPTEGEEMVKLGIPAGLPGGGSGPFGPFGVGSGDRGLFGPSKEEADKETDRIFKAALEERYVRNGDMKRG